MRIGISIPAVGSTALIGIAAAMLCSYPDDPGLVCWRGWLSPVCNLRSDGSYHGFHIAMSKETAFDNACSPSETGHFHLDTLQGGVDYPSANRNEVVRQPLTCAYRNRALTYDYWQISSDFGSCAGLERDSISFLFQSGKLKKMWITCGGLVV